MHMPGVLQKDDGKAQARWELQRPFALLPRRTLPDNVVESTGQQGGCAGSWAQLVECAGAGTSAGAGHGARELAAPHAGSGARRRAG